jgi:hypothetical protein
MRVRITLAAMLLAAVPVLAEPAKGSPDLVPPTSFAFVTAKVSDLQQVEALKPVREMIAKIEKMEGRRVEEQLGVPLNAMDRITLFWPASPGESGSAEPIIIVTTVEAYNEAKVLKALNAIPAGESRRRHRGGSAPKQTAPGIGERPAAIPVPVPPVKEGPLPVTPGSDPKAEKDPAPTGDAPELYFREHGIFSAVYLLDDRTIVLLPESDRGLLSLVGQLLRRKADGLLADALAEAGKHTVVAAAQVGPINDLLHGEERFPPELVPFRSLLKSKTVTLTADIAAKTTFTVKLTFPDAATTRRAEPVLKTLIELGIEKLGELGKKAGEDAELAKVLQPLLELATGALEKAEVKADGTTLTAQVSAEIGPAVTKALDALPAVLEAAAGRVQTSNNLKQIGLALHNYHDTYGNFPGNVMSPDGKVLMSWRVAILPFIEQDNMYRALDLTKAWDDPVNAKILANMPKVFEVRGREAEKGKTYLQMPYSPKALPGGSPFLVPGQKTTFANITDGTSNTLMVVEATDAVSWAKPDDLLFDPQKLPKLGDPKTKRFHTALGDGSVRIFKRDKLTDDQLKALLTINGGEVIDLKD